MKKIFLVLVVCLLIGSVAVSAGLFDFLKSPSKIKLSNAPKPVNLDFPVGNLEWVEVDVGNKVCADYFMGDFDRIQIDEGEVRLFVQDNESGWVNVSLYSGGMPYTDVFQEGDWKDLGPIKVKIGKIISNLTSTNPGVEISIGIGCGLEQREIVPLSQTSSVVAQSCSVVDFESGSSGNQACLGYGACHFVDYNQYNGAQLKAHRLYDCSEIVSTQGNLQAVCCL